MKIIYLGGEIGEDVKLLDVIKQVKEADEGEEITVVVDSVGGSVEEGNLIYNYLQNLEVIVTTVAQKAYSIAAKIFCAGNIRKVPDSDNAFMMHLPWVQGVTGDAEELEVVAAELRQIEADFVAFYSEFLGLDKGTVLAMLEKETFLSGVECVELGIATEIKEEVKALAKCKTKTVKNMKKTKKVALMAAFDAFKSSMMAALAVNLVLQDATGSEIDFEDLDTGDIPKVGDTAKIDGDQVPDGAYTMPSISKIVTFVGGAVTEISDIEEEQEETDDEETPNPVEEAEAKAEMVGEVNIYYMDVVETDIKIGTKLHYKGWDDETRPVSSGEYVLEDGRHVTASASGEVVSIDKTNQIKAKEKDAQIAEKDAQIAKQKAEITALNKKLGTKEFQQTPPAQNGGEKKTLAQILSKKS